MGKIKNTLMTGLMALVLMFLPQASFAADVSIGFFLGLPIPIVTVDPPRVHHVPPPVVVAPHPIHPHGYAYGHEKWRHKKFSHYYNRPYAHRDYGYRDYGREYRHDGNGGRWDRR